MVKNVVDFMQYFQWPQDKWVFQLGQTDMHTILSAQLKAFGYKTIEHVPDGYTYAPGTIPIMLVAHTDTVHHKAPEVILYDPESTYMWSPQGIGADDRAGIWGILSLLRAGFKPHVLFVCDEETGCKGARKAVNTFEEAPDVRFIVELDRRGSVDMVFYQCANEKFTNYVESFGFKEAIGSCSDISTLCPDWKIAGVNLSTGYYEQHSKSEHLVVSELAATCRKVSGMLKNVPANTFVFERKAYPVYKSSYGEWVNGKWVRNNDDGDIGYSSYYGDTYNKRFQKAKAPLVIDYRQKTPIVEGACNNCTDQNKCRNVKERNIACMYRLPKYINMNNKYDTCLLKYTCKDANEGCVRCLTWKDGGWDKAPVVKCTECKSCLLCWSDTKPPAYEENARLCSYWQKAEKIEKSCKECMFAVDCYEILASTEEVPDYTTCPEWAQEYPEPDDLPAYDAVFDEADNLVVTVSPEDLFAWSTEGTAAQWRIVWEENKAEVLATVLDNTEIAIQELVESLEMLISKVDTCVAK